MQTEIITPELVINEYKYLVLRGLAERKRGFVREMIGKMCSFKSRYYTPSLVRFIVKADRLYKWMCLPENRGLWRKCNPQTRASFEYHEWRMNVLNRDKWVCVDCGAKSNLCVHHIKHYKDYPSLRIDVSNGVTVCGDCHKKRHRDA